MFDDLVKSLIQPIIVIPVKTESSEFKYFWTPAFAGVTV